jgi:hypothetical protein
VSCQGAFGRIAAYPLANLRAHSGALPLNEFTYELFGDLRKKALETIKEQRDLLIKINAAETTMHNLLKKHNSEKFM